MRHDPVLQKTKTIQTLRKSTTLIKTQTKPKVKKDQQTVEALVKTSENDLVPVHFHKYSNKPCFAKHKEDLDTGLQNQKIQAAAKKWKKLSKKQKVRAIRNRVLIVKLCKIRQKAALRKISKFLTNLVYERREMLAKVRELEL